MGTLGFGGDFQFARVFAPLGKRIGEFCRAMVLLKQLAQTYRQVFPEFSNATQLQRRNFAKILAIFSLVDLIFGFTWS